MTVRPVVFFCMPGRGHFNRLRPLISGLSRRGIPAQVFSESRHQPEIERAGGAFLDLFARYSVEAVDDESWPSPCRFVSFAGEYGDRIRRDVEALNPSLIIHDTFAVIGPVVANLLGIPHVNVCAGHAVVPSRYQKALDADARVRISPACWRAVEFLRAHCGMPDASPFSYMSALSPHLNIYCEPPEFLDETDRLVFEPIAFYGSVPSPEDLEFRPEGDHYFKRGSGRDLKVYISFGTVVWNVRKAEALDALTSLAESLSRMRNVSALISLGGRAELGADIRDALTRPGVAVESYVDQWKILHETDVFVTHHGLNSTHEAIFHCVPMISYPFGWDQPSLAGACQQFGLAIPLTEQLRGNVRDEDVRLAFSRVSSAAGSLRDALSTAREWERNVMAKRPGVLDRVVDLCG